MRNKTDQVCRITAFLVGITVAAGIFSCENFLEVPAPHDQLLSSAVFSSEASATAALTGIYSLMINNNGFASGSATAGTTFIAGVLADELISYDQTYKDEFYTNSISPSNSVLRYFWNEPYQYIYTCNAIVEGLTNESSSIPLIKKNALIAEAKFVRAFCYFYLINNFGEVPLHVSTDYKASEFKKRQDLQVINDSIIQDLKTAQQMLPDARGSDTRPTKEAATAMLARAYLYIGDWNNSVIQSASLINGKTPYTLENELQDVFLTESRETIWKMPSSQADINTLEGYHFILDQNPETYQKQALRPELLSAFEDNDKRKTAWIGMYKDNDNFWHYPQKYRIKTSSTNIEDYVVLRLAEQYLIYSEANAHIGKYQDAIKALNLIRERAGITPFQPIDNKEYILEMIAEERKKELFAEWGHRWYDLKRTGKADDILGPLKATNWQSSDQLMPIPIEELLNSPGLVQNIGY